MTVTTYGPGMGLREQIKGRGGALVERATEASLSTSQRMVEGFRGFRQVLAEGEQTGVEAYLTALVAAVRRDNREEEDDEATHRDVFLRARKRRRKLGVVCLGTGPMAGMASRLADIYCEIATLCDVADLHGLAVDDSRVAAHMLVLWSIVSDEDEAERVMGGEPPLAQVLEEKLIDRVGVVKSEEGWTPRSIANAIWEVQNIQTATALGDLKAAADGQPVRSVLFTGHRVKKVIRRAEAQLGVEAERPRRWWR